MSDLQKKYDRLLKTNELIYKTFYCLVAIDFVYLIYAAVAMPILLWSAIPLMIAFVIFPSLMSRKIDKKISAIKKELFGEAQQSIPSNPLFIELVDEYQNNGLELFVDSIKPIGWKLSEVDYYNNIITIIFTKKGHEIYVEIDNDEISICFDEESDDITYNKALTSANFADPGEIIAYIRETCKEYLRKQ